MSCAIKYPLVPIGRRKLYCLIFFHLFGIASVGYCQSYYTGGATESPGKYRNTDYYTLTGIPNTDKPMAKKMLEAIVDATKYVYADPIGADVGPYGGIFKNYRGNSEVTNGPYMFDMTIAFYELLKTKNGAIEASGEYSSSIMIWVNYAKYFLQANPVQYGNDRVFRKPIAGISVNGYPKYNNMILLLPDPKRLPWRPATKQEYLENFMTALKASFAGRSVNVGEEKLIPKVQQMLATMSDAEKKEIAYLKKAKYDDYKTGYSEVMTLAWGDNKWKGFQNEKDTTAEQLVIIDENYYDKTISRNSFQLIAIARQYPRATISAAAPTKEAIKDAERISDRLNNVVRAKDYLSQLSKLLGKSGLDYVSGKPVKQPQQKTLVVTKPKIKNIEHILDSLMRKYNPNFPVIPAVASPPVANSTVPSKLPAPNQKKLAFAARRLNTKQELVQYLDTLEKKISIAYAGTTVPNFSDQIKANKAAYGYWIFQKPREALLTAIQAAKKQPEDNTSLNNLGATLSLLGVDYLAVPIYHVCISKETGSSTLYNNLGQSYLALGDAQKAEMYLMKAIALTPRHHHANNSLGFLYRMRGNNAKAMECYENSIRNSFTLEGFNGLKALNSDSAKKLMNYIKHRYKQPDYINFDKYPAPPQCVKHDETLIRIAQHKEYKRQIDIQKRKFQKLRDKQKPIADSSLRAYFMGDKKKSIRPFLPFAGAMVVSIHLEFLEKLKKLDKELKELQRTQLRLRIECDTLLKQVDEAFEPRADKIGEGNPDPSFDEDYCAAKNSVIDAYLPQFAEINEEKFKKTIHAWKDYLNDYLYWVRFASFTDEQYQLEFYEIALHMYWVLERLELTTINGYCEPDPAGTPTNDSLNLYKPDCPLPVGVEIPFVVGKINFDCESWGFEIGEGIVLNVDHLMGGATTLAIGPGAQFFSTPNIGGDAPMDIKPGIDAGIKGQVFVTFDANTVMDWGLLIESEFDLKGVGKPIELKQNVTIAVNKGFTVDGVVTTAIDKLFFDEPPVPQINKNVKPYKPQ
jgi:tetratricopeptide (TPR) repeat protein